MQDNSAFKLKWIRIFVEEARSALTGFHVDPPSGQIGFVSEGKLGTWRNLLKRSNSQPTYMHGTQNKTQDTLVGGECPYQCIAPSLPPTKLWFFLEETTSDFSGFQASPLCSRIGIWVQMIFLICHIAILFRLLIWHPSAKDSYIYLGIFMPWESAANERSRHNIFMHDNQHGILHSLIYHVMS